MLLRTAIAPGVREEVLNVRAEEKEVVQERNKGHQPVEREKTCRKQENNVQGREAEVNPGHVFHLDGDEHHEKDSCVGREGRDGEEQAEVQVGRGDAVAEKKTGEVRQENAREIIEVKAARAPVVLQHLAELVITEETDNGEEQITARDIEQICEHIGEQPPDLPLQDLARGEAEKTVDHAAWVNDGQRIGNEIADGDDEHQVRNAAIAVLETEAFKFFAEIFHMSTYLFA